MTETLSGPSQHLSTLLPSCDFIGVSKPASIHPSTGGMVGANISNIKPLNKLINRVAKLVARTGSPASHETGKFVIDAPWPDGLCKSTPIKSAAEKNQ